MKRSRFTDEKIIGILKKQQANATVKDLCHKRSVSDAAFYKWQSRYGRRGGNPRGSKRQIEKAARGIEAGHLDVSGDAGKEF